MSKKNGGFVESLITLSQKKAEKNSKFLQSIDNLPFMEPRLRSLYIETHAITLLGFANASIIIQGVLLEATLKEIIYSHEKRNFEGELGPAIKYCLKKGYIEQKDYDFCESFRKGYRNMYQHFDVEEQVEGSHVMGWQIKIDKNDVAGSILRGIINIREGIAGAPTKITPNELRPVADIIKETRDKDIYIESFLNIAYFVRKMARKHFPIN
jgi:hypothetical protein